MLVLLLFSIPPLKGFRLLVLCLIFIGYLLTNGRKTAIFHVFRAFWRFLAISYLVLQHD